MNKTIGMAWSGRTSVLASAEDLVLTFERMVDDLNPSIDYDVTDHALANRLRAVASRIDSYVQARRRLQGED